MKTFVSSSDNGKFIFSSSTGISFKSDKSDTPSFVATKVSKSFSGSRIIGKNLGSRK